MQDKLLTTKEVAEMLSVKENTISQWRYYGSSSLKWVYIGAAVRYKESDVKAFINMVTPTPRVKTLNVTIPDAFSNLPNRTMITKKELANMIGKSARSISRLQVEGLVPNAINQHSAHRPTNYVWSLGSIRELKKKMDNLKNAM